MLSSFEIASSLKMNEYKVKVYMTGAANKPWAKLKRALELSEEADLAMKLGGGYAVIEQLVCTL